MRLSLLFLGSIEERLAAFFQVHLQIEPRSGNLYRDLRSSLTPISHKTSWRLLEVFELLGKAIKRRTRLCALVCSAYARCELRAKRHLCSTNKLYQNHELTFVSPSLFLPSNLTQVNFDHELINQLNNHYNKNRHIEVSAQTN